MTIFHKNITVTVYCWDLATGIFIGSKEYSTEAGFGLPNGMTLDAPVLVTGKVAVRNKENSTWCNIDDDRGREFYFKFDGTKYTTVILHEEPNQQYFTEVEPPFVEDGQLVRFNDELQEWQIGFSWYDKPIWNVRQEETIYLGDFFVPSRNHTHIEPPQNAEGYILDDAGLWVRPITAYHKDTHQEQAFDYRFLVTKDYTLIKPATEWDEWIDGRWVTNTQKKYIDEYSRVDAAREQLYRLLIDPLEGEASRKSRQGKLDAAQMLYERIDEIETKIKAENPFPVSPIK